MGTLTVTFDRPLVVGPLFAPSWGWVRNLNGYTGIAAQVPPGAPTTVIVTAGLPGPAPPGALCAYAAIPPDLIGQNGVPVAPFADFPIT